MANLIDSDFKDSEFEPGTVNARFAWLLRELEARLPGVVCPFSSRPPELALIEALDQRLLDDAQKTS